MSDRPEPFQVPRSAPDSDGPLSPSTDGPADGRTGVTSGRSARPRFAYENPADLAWGAQLIRTGLRRKRLRLAAEAAETDRAERGGDDGQ